MTDSQEILPKEEVKQTVLTEMVNPTTEETTQVASPDMTNNGAKDDVRKVYTTKAEITERLKELVQDNDAADRAELDLLKQAFYKIVNTERSEARTAFIEAGGEAEAFKPEADPEEDVFKAQMSVLRERRNKMLEEVEQQKENNLKRKLEIIEKIKELASSPEEANKSYDSFKALQAEWKEVKNVPAKNANELWGNYQFIVEQYYDLLKQNNELREYDFKKNLEIKTKLCEAAEKLATEDDVISAFHQLQTLHNEYREVGPVAKTLREELWDRFKAASVIVNKRHADHFELLKAKEEENLTKKTALCEKIEAINPDENKTFSQWDEDTKAILEIQAEWKSIGQATKKMNTKIFERFRAACDIFFQKKAEFFKTQKESYNENLAKKTEICLAAEALKDSEDWVATGKKLIQLQKDWKSVGTVPKKASDAIWKRFNTACNEFFEKRTKATSSQRKEETENLANKKAIIEKLKAIGVEGGENVSQAVRDLMHQWNEIGHVPFRDKDKLFKKYHEVVDGLYKEFNIQASKRRIENFKNNLKDGDGLSGERNKLFRAYEAKKGELSTYENNLGFLSSSSKSGNSLVNEMNKKMERIKDELNEIQEKIAVIDQQIKEQKQ